MNYQITQHYAKGEEERIAEFSVLHQAKLFLTKKSMLAAEAKKQIIYRLYDNEDVLQTSNNMHVSVAFATYAEGNGDFNRAEPLEFQVWMKANDDSKQQAIARFHDQKDAYLYVTCLYESYQDEQNTVFFIYQNQNLITILDKTKIKNQNKELAQNRGSNQGSTAHMSPLSTRPTPDGGPPDYWVNHDDEKLS
tara:strand:- start:391 stop:969 length:579 start_codon:yes stop_codon:yes gene_type:complete